MKLVNYQPVPNAGNELGIVLGEWVFAFAPLAEWVITRLSGKTFRKLAAITTIDNALSDWENFYPLALEMVNRLEDYHPDDLSQQKGLQCYDITEIHFLPPVPLSTCVFRDFYAFEQHVKTARANRGLEMIPEWYEMPVFYFSNARSLRGHREVIPKPPYTHELDYELEVGCVIGKKGKDISAGEAWKYIAGFTIINDWSARDIQRKEMKVGLGPAKGKDFATSVGPFLITPDELASYRKGKGFDLIMRAYRNGEKISEGNWSSIYYSFEEMIERASAGTELVPGDLLGSGTVGTGCILELGPDQAGGWLEVGDTVVLEVERLGELENTIVPYA